MAGGWYGDLKPRIDMAALSNLTQKKQETGSTDLQGLHRTNFPPTTHFLEAQAARLQVGFQNIPTLALGIGRVSSPVLPQERLVERDDTARQARLEGQNGHLSSAWSIDKDIYRYYKFGQFGSRLQQLTATTLTATKALGVNSGIMLLSAPYGMPVLMVAQSAARRRRLAASSPLFWALPRIPLNSR
ncbi:hypothetical protein CHU98_g12194 [Xylaria longipes]|nr:hypothetical protein CHU98_g12194 [Xylaria longipes]